MNIIKNTYIIKNTSIDDISELKNLTLQDITPSAKVIHTIEITELVKSGSRGSLPLAKIKDAFEKDRDFEIVISYAGNDRISDNVAIDIDLDGIEPEKGDNAVAYFFLYNGEPLEYNQPIILTSEETMNISACKLIDSEIIDRISTSIYKIYITGR